MSRTSHNMLDLIRHLPKEIEEAIEFDIPDPWQERPDIIVFSGMGGSGISGDLTKILLESTHVPVVVHKDYGIPSCVTPHSWVFVTSYSGNTEEAISSFEDAIKIGSKIVVITSGGTLKKLAMKNNVPVISVPSGFPPRAALGYLFIPVVNFLKRGGLLSEDIDLVKLVMFLKSQSKALEEMDSIAHDLAEKFYLRIPVLYASRRYFPVVERWRTQINENSKAFAHTSALPEMNHNEITGLLNPDGVIEGFWAIFFQFPDDHPRIKLRIKETIDLVSGSVMGVSLFVPKGTNILENIFYTILVGDYVSYFLAINYNQDPISIPRIDELKRRLSK